MKAIKSKKLNKQINTVCDFNSYPKFLSGTNPSETDPTNTTITIITTVNTGVGLKG